MDERDGLLLAVAIGLLGASAVLTARILRCHNEAITAHDEDIAFLKAAFKNLDARVD